VWRGQVVLGPVREVGAVEVLVADTAMQTDEVRPAVMMISRIPMDRCSRLKQVLGSFGRGGVHERGLRWRVAGAGGVGACA
jgi:hypothetical protein